MNYTWGSERRLNTYSDYFKREFGGRVQKITLDAGFTCPNRDGTSGTGGCTFCNNKAFNPSYNDPEKSIESQILQGMKFHKTRYRKATRFLAYFQAYSNTYSSLEHMQSLYEQALKVPGIIGIVVGTRPDCVDEDKLNYFQELSLKHYVTVEYGIESVINRTLQRVNRGHDVEKSLWAVRETARRGIRVGGHMIIGLPGEDRQDFLDSGRELSRWPLNNIKFHQLQIIRHTAMAREFEERPREFVSFTLEEYLELMMEIVEQLNPSIVVERIAGEVTPGMGIRDGWGIRYDRVLQAFEDLLEKHDTWQGKKFKLEE
ncbi:MAG: TIGR01212 family radical SAM protein [Bacteroidetes bacterium]|nr:MAG: TIGR01212 family radical SAM protein [Bacteroidota bacterium]